MVNPVKTRILSCYLLQNNKGKWQIYSYSKSTQNLFALNPATNTKELICSGLEHVNDAKLIMKNHFNKIVPP